MKIAKKRRRAEINKKLGVKRLKLVPMSKPKSGEKLQTLPPWKMPTGTLFL